MAKRDKAMAGTGGGLGESQSDISVSKISIRQPMNQDFEEQESIKQLLNTSNRNKIACKTLKSDSNDDFPEEHKEYELDS